MSKHWNGTRSHPSQAWAQRAGIPNWIKAWGPSQGKQSSSTKVRLNPRPNRKATQEPQGGGPCRSQQTVLRGWGVTQWWSASLVSVRPWAPSLAPQSNKQHKETDYLPVILATHKGDSKILFLGQRGQSYHETLSEKQTKNRRTGGVARVVECLPSKCKALRSNPSTAKPTNENPVIITRKLIFESGVCGSHL
jgi:hypothetical protein